MKPYTAYKLYLSCKNHFESIKYDMYKFNFKTRTSLKSYNDRRDKKIFIALAKKYEMRDLFYFYCGNLIYSNHKYIADFTEEYYFQLKRFIENFSYEFKNEIEIIKKYLTKNKTSFSDSVKIKNEEYPIIIQLYLQRKIQIHTLLCLDIVFDFLEKIDKKMVEYDSIIWPDVYKKLKNSKIVFKNILDIKKILSCVKSIKIS